MIKLTTKEEELMGYFWEKGPLFIKEILGFYDEPKPHFNTISTVARGLEEKGLLGHKAYGTSYQYYAIVSKEEYGSGTLLQVVNKYFSNSYLGAVSALVREENISVDELKQLISQVEKGEL